jgi:hypothetical protein
MSTSKNPVETFVENFKEESKSDLLFLGTLAAATAYFPNTVFTYNNRAESLSYMVIYLAPPASGKGILSNVHNIILPLNKHLGGSEVYISADSTDASFLESLNQSKSMPLLMIDSEIKILLTSKKGEHGKKLRTNIMKAFSFEEISLERRGAKAIDRRKYHITEPRLSVVLTGTPGDYGPLFGYDNDGFISRLHLVFRDEFTAWKSPKPTKIHTNLKQKSIEFGEKLLVARKYLSKLDKPLEITFKENHWTRIDQFGSNPMSFGLVDENEFVRASIFRAGSRVFKVAANLTLIRNADGLSGQTIECNDYDFNLAFDLVVNDFKKIAPRLAFGNNNLSNPDKTSENICIDLLKDLGKVFETHEFNKAAKEAGLSNSTAKRFLKKSSDEGKLLVKREQGKYKNHISNFFPDESDKAEGIRPTPQKPGF